MNYRDLKNLSTEESDKYIKYLENVPMSIGFLARAIEFYKNIDFHIAFPELRKLLFHKEPMIQESTINVLSNFLEKFKNDGFHELEILDLLEDKLNTDDELHPIIEEIIMETIMNS